MPASTPAPDNAHARIWAIAGPSILANSSSPLVGIVDSWAVGHLPDPLLLAAVGIATFLFDCIFWTFAFLRMGTTGLVAQAHGGGDIDQVRRVVLRSLVLGVAGGALLLLLRDPFLVAGLAFMEADGVLARATGHYFSIRIWAAPAFMIKLAAMGFLLGTGRAGWALLVEVSLNLVNAGLTAWFVVGQGWGIAGAAWGSLIAEWLSALFCLALMLTLLGAKPLRHAVSQRDFWQFVKFRRLLAVNGFILLRTLCLLAAFALLWKISLGLGALTVAANQLLRQFVFAAALGLDGLAYAIEAEVGRAIGRRDRALFDRMVQVTALWCGVAASLYAALYAGLGPAAIGFFTPHEAVRGLAGTYLPWLIAMPPIAVWSYFYDGIYVGATAARAMFLTMALSLCIYGAAMALLVPAFGNHGIWASFLVLNAARGLSQAALYARVRDRALKA